MLLYGIVNMERSYKSDTWDVHSLGIEVVHAECISFLFSPGDLRSDEILQSSGHLYPDACNEDIPTAEDRKLV